MNFRITSIHEIVLMMAALLLPACEQEVGKRDIDSEIQHVMTEHDLPSIAACVIKDNAIVWKKAYGYSDVENQTPASDETIYNVGSISKLIIATAIFQLVEQGRLDIDNDINQYSSVPIRNPHFPESPITTRMLMTHSAGIAWPDNYSEALGLWEHYDLDEAPRPDEWVPQYLLPSGQHYNPLIWKNRKPGSIEGYSNIGANVLAFIIEQITNQDFRDYCRANIFIPLNMQNTSFNYSDLELDNIAVLYRNNNTISPPFDDPISASGGLKTTINDFSRFLMAYLNGGEYEGSRILQQTSINRLLEIQNQASGTCLIWNAEIGGWFGHTGGMIDGAASLAEIQTNKKLGMIIFCNKHSNTVYHGNIIFGLVRQKAIALNFL